MNKKLFTRDFTIFIAGSVVCCIADVAMSFLMSVIVYDETASTLLSGIFFATSFLPNIVVPLFFSSWVDASNKKNIMVGCDLLIGIMYILGFFVFRKTGFNYILFTCFDLICGSIGAVYQIGYTAYFPCLLDKENYQKGYTIFNMVYPVCSVVFSPVTAYLYQIFGLTSIMLVIGIMMLLVTIFDGSLKNSGYRKEIDNSIWNLKVTVDQLIEARTYLRKEKGLNHWYWYRAIDEGLGSLRSLMIIAFFTSNPLLGVSLYSFLGVSQFVGRAIISVFNFKHKYKNENKTFLTILVYFIYDSVDGVLLFLTYPVMLILGVVSGALGNTTMTLRESAVMSYIPENDRGKINSLLQLRSFVFSSIFSLVGGGIGDLLGVRETMVLATTLSIIAIIVFVIPSRKDINHIFMSEK